MAAGAWEGWAAAVAALSLVAACGGQRGLVSAPPASGAGHDAAAQPGLPVVDAGGPPPVDATLPSNDSGPPAMDGGSSVADGAAPPPLALADGCDLQDGRFFSPVSAGTLPAAGPYHPCRPLGGTSFSPVALSADATRILALDVMGQAAVLDGATLKVVALFARAQGPYTSVALSPTGNLLAAGSESDGELDLFDVTDRTVRWAVDLGPAFSLYGGGLAFSPDGTQIAATVGPDVALVDVATGTVRRYTDGTRCCGDQVLFVDGGRKLATARYGYDPVGSGSPLVTLLDLASGNLTTVLKKDDIYGWMNLATSAHGRTLVAFRESEVYAGDVSTGAPLTPVLTPGSFQEVLGVDATATFVGVIADDLANSRALLRVLRIADGTLVRELPVGPGMTFAFWSLDRDRLVVTTRESADGSRLGVIDTAGRQTLARACFAATPVPYAAATAAPRLAAVGTGVAVYDVNSGQPIGPVLGAGEVPNSVSLAPDGEWVTWSTFLSNGTTAVKLANAVTGQEQTIAGPAPGSMTAVPSSGGQLAAVEDQSGLLQIIDVTSGTPLAQLSGRGRGRGIPPAAAPGKRG